MTQHSPLGTCGPHRLANAVAYGVSDVGPVRDSNEDNFLIDTGLGLLAVADGMGGHEAGAQASACALNSLRDFLDDHALATVATSVDPDATWSDPDMRAVGVLHDAIECVNARLYAQNVARQRSEGSGMGTTLTGFWRPQDEGPMIVFHVGDSRLYRWREGELALLTRDQTWYQQALEAGKVDRLPARNLLLQAIGPSPRVEPQIRAQQVLAGDLLMLCSDGLHGCVPHQEIANVLAVATAQTLDAVCQYLVTLAGDYGGRDNVTVLLALCAH
ncbi:PP2C family protein-serine/threonine phosphatase [Pseudomonas gingeri]|uniref:Serine/threonine-protein phosphatase n=1 Tax=Pseudomonas gingeri TaxID=117681 RepID=A0A7Y7YA96_9PSED|nr:protein phosphatase 2C domain-containing protein [Pseudomonas gingeri]NWA02517.1 serine/threonine-protein phosphatase [Pseudomonas gingeri]NWA12310.1 serine/threonine-protein phosphatase [Pseudomonas gingeri]NWA57284.1 serine/threonine-protein phosphatase [Pseudomonas gingeri]NWA93627.1 serine/threonine-protein phosphatase [Pseudomonas gingeri]NWB03099.1 serine/threonine-protein phosphatase [Pseudomonas gingeri]